MPVQKQTRAGQRTRFKAIVAVGDGNGHIGLGVKCAKEVATAIRGAIILAKLSVIPVRRGYWGNKIGLPHTVPCKVGLNRIDDQRSIGSNGLFRWQAHAAVYWCVWFQHLVVRALFVLRFRKSFCKWLESKTVGPQLKDALQHWATSVSSEFETRIYPRRLCPFSQSNICRHGHDLFLSHTWPLERNSLYKNTFSRT